MVLIYRYNAIDIDYIDTDQMLKARTKAIKEVFGQTGENILVEPPFVCGKNRNT